MFAGPAAASPSFFPSALQSRTRQRVPPPSTPSKSVSGLTDKHLSARVFDSLTHQNESGSAALTFDYQHPVAHGQHRAPQPSLFGDRPLGFLRHPGRDDRGAVYGGCGRAGPPARAPEGGPCPPVQAARPPAAGLLPAPGPPRRRGGRRRPTRAPPPP